MTEPEPEVIALWRAHVNDPKAQGYAHLPVGDLRAIYEHLDALATRCAAAEVERDRLMAALTASSDEMTIEFCKLADTLRDEMADKRELLHRLETHTDTVRSDLLVADQDNYRLNADLAAARAQVAAMEADAKRLDFLEAAKVVRARFFPLENPPRWELDAWDNTTGATLREAIDAALPTPTPQPEQDDA